MSDKKIKYVCPNCGSDSINATQNLEQYFCWEIEKQRWRWVADNGVQATGYYCPDCYYSGNDVKEVEIEK